MQRLLRAAPQGRGGAAKELKFNATPNLLEYEVSPDSTFKRRVKKRKRPTGPVPNHHLRFYDDVNQRDADDWKALEKWACHYHALMLASGQGLQFDCEGNEDKWHGHLEDASPVKSMIVWTATSGYVMSCVDYDPSWFKKR